MQVRLSPKITAIVKQNAVKNGRSVPKELEIIVPLYYLCVAKKK